MALMLSSQATTLLNRPPIRPSISRFSSGISLPRATGSVSFPIQHQQKTLNPLSVSPSIKTPSIRVSASQTPCLTPPQTQQQSTLLTGSTRTITTILALALTLSRICLNSISILPKLALQNASSLAQSVGPLFFAAMNDRPSGYLNTPLTVVAAGLAKWLDIYSGVLMVRVLLSWFPNIPWDRQPLSAIRDLCDPYLNLFRNIIPPIFDTLDVSPLLAFAVLGTLGSILHSSGGVY
ncbi:ylmG homolog protein 1-1, chloroplastic [Mercurialis annua]|uniref:ylmG homolog protein 1-1, chloroplastic n=1 Tax=Mercurialis annua TaxID=3986 RepID=UPI002160EFE8|nr:ylmG homolog protein 1-1, chloroplastic [Mercurialis annua]